MLGAKLIPSAERLKQFATSHVFFTSGVSVAFGATLNESSLPHGYDLDVDAFHSS